MRFKTGGLSRERRESSESHNEEQVEGTGKQYEAPHTSRGPQGNQLPQGRILRSKNIIAILTENVNS